MTDTGTLFLNQQDVIDAGAADVDWVGAVLEQVFKLHEEQAFTAGRGPDPFSMDTATDFGGGVQ